MLNEDSFNVEEHWMGQIFYLVRCVSCVLYTAALITSLNVTLARCCWCCSWCTHFIPPTHTLQNLPVNWSNGLNISSTCKKQQQQQYLWLFVFCCVLYESNIWKENWLQSYVLHGICKSPSIHFFLSNIVFITNIWGIRYHTVYGFQYASSLVFYPHFNWSWSSYFSAYSSIYKYSIWKSLLQLLLLLLVPVLKFKIPFYNISKYCRRVIYGFFLVVISSWPLQMSIWTRWRIGSLLVYRFIKDVFSWYGSTPVLSGCKFWIESSKFLYWGKISWLSQEKRLSPERLKERERVAEKSFSKSLTQQVYRCNSKCGMYFLVR
jgi:hypothetical protein